MATCRALLRTLCCSIPCVLCFAGLTCAQCSVKFRFPEVDQTTTPTVTTNPTGGTFTVTSPVTLSVNKGSSLNIHFTVDTEGCYDDHHNFTISVREQSQSTKTTHPADFCKILYKNDLCASFRPHECICAKEGRTGFFLMKDFDNDIALAFKAISQDRILEAQATVNVVVTHPPKVTALTFLTYDDASGKWDELRSEPVAPGTELAIRCSYDVGKPPVSTATVRIVYGAEPGDKISGQGKEEKDERKTAGRKVVRFRVKDGVNCSDSGAVTCRVAGASKNITSMLLVKCPPYFLYKKERWFEGRPYQTMTMLFNLHSHTRDLTACTLTSIDYGVTNSPQDHTGGEGADGNVADSHKCSKPGRNLTVFGTPPVLTLQLVIQNLPPSDDGLKMLTVFNDAGSDSVRFGLQIASLNSTKDAGIHYNIFNVDAAGGKEIGGVDARPGSAALPADDDDSNASLIVGIAIGATAVFVITSVAITVVLVRRRRTSHVQRRIALRPQDRNRNARSNHLYDDLARGQYPPISAASNVYSEPASGDDDYLHPIPPGPPSPPPVASSFTNTNQSPQPLSPWKPNAQTNATAREDEGHDLEDQSPLRRKTRLPSDKLPSPPWDLRIPSQR